MRHMRTSKARTHYFSRRVHPTDPDIVYIGAASGGIWKTTDGGESWTKLLDISENTGATDLVMDPRDPNTMYTAAYQRRRHLWTLIDGGPGSGIHKTTDGGATWTELTKGLPGARLAVMQSSGDTILADQAGVQGRRRIVGEGGGDLHVLEGDRQVTEGEVDGLGDGVQSALDRLFGREVGVFHQSHDGGLVEAAATIAAARLVGAHEFIASIEKGYESPVGEGGVRLGAFPGGQGG